jgi:UDP-2,3-diacylglucosamine hydrolase
MDRTAAPPIQELHAPGAWNTLEFISDLHLQPTEPATFEAWRRYMRESAADALFILGDLFEVWVGDDEASEPGFAADCAGVLRDAARRRPVFFMHGNRDFLLSEELLGRCGVTLLADPTVLGFAGGRWLLTHGDALCLEDTGYLRFREEVRDAGWQRQFLAQPLAQRREIARGLRERSEAAQQMGLASIDVDATAAREWLEAADAPVMIHGHTHRPAEHVLGAGRTRIVLSDWDASAEPQRLQALRLDTAGWRRVPLA